MCWWYGNAWWPVWGWWWLVPLIGIALCIIMCLFFRSRIAGGRFYCWSGASHADFEEMKKEIRELKEEIAKITGK
jgi:hypothetical protein